MASKESLQWCQTRSNIAKSGHLLCRAAAPGKLAAQWQLTGMMASGRPHRCRELIQVIILITSPSRTVCQHVSRQSILCNGDPTSGTPMNAGNRKHAETNLWSRAGINAVCHRSCPAGVAGC